VALAGDDAVRAAHGMAVADADGCAGPVRLLDPDGALVALAEPREDRLLKPVVVLRPASAA
jgi:hypothetical protein